jgi:hypothetical protein
MGAVLGNGLLNPRRQRGSHPPPGQRPYNADATKRRYKELRCSVLLPSMQHRQGQDHCAWFNWLSRLSDWRSGVDRWFAFARLQAPRCPRGSRPASSAATAAVDDFLLRASSAEFRKTKSPPFAVLRIRFGPLAFLRLMTRLARPHPRSSYRCRAGRRPGRCSGFVGCLRRLSCHCAPVRRAGKPTGLSNRWPKLS